MKKIRIKRENNYLTMFRPFKIFINGKFVDYIEPKEKNKVIQVDSSSFELKIGVNNCESNAIKIDDANSSKDYQFSVTSQVQNGLFIFAFITFFGSVILTSLGFIQNIYLSIALLLPFCIIAYWQTIGRKKYLRLSNSSYSLMD
ncbi:hypothetical protein MHTCC0001_16010 [Flavobacteriaceae bacterium MHTCC 0001]